MLDAKNKKPEKCPLGAMIEKTAYFLSITPNLLICKQKLFIPCKLQKHNLFVKLIKGRKKKRIKIFSNHWDTISKMNGITLNG
ncbi:MAG TPA: hypothetical protein PKL52_09585 [Tenuifilaceae bacterium]|nr:hypothetical protein [Tenuifilaceae bacterium]